MRSKCFESSKPIFFLQVSHCSPAGVLPGQVERGCWWKGRRKKDQKNEKGQSGCPGRAEVPRPSAGDVFWNSLQVWVPNCGTWVQKKQGRHGEVIQGVSLGCGGTFGSGASWWASPHTPRACDPEEGSRVCQRARLHRRAGSWVSTTAHFARPDAH